MVTIIADVAHEVSVTDIDAMVNLIREGHFDGMITGFSDLLHPYYAEICEKAGIPAYGTKEQFEIFTNKGRYKALIRKYGIPTVEEYQIDLGNFVSDVEIIKYMEG